MQSNRDPFQTTAPSPFLHVPSFMRFQSESNLVSQMHVGNHPRPPMKTPPPRPPSRSKLILNHGPRKPSWRPLRPRSALRPWRVAIPSPRIAQSFFLPFGISNPIYVLVNSCSDRKHNVTLSLETKRKSHTPDFWFR